ncbi:MAG TPA: acyl-CoA thioesterase [Desulfobacteraceae bacterium]|nr:acyl-CoA thioesterase [Desulfobacteraceae bacterium]
MEPEIKIRGYHTDLYQHVNNARYLEFLEEARWQLVDDYLDMDFFVNKGYFFFVVNVNISYKGQARANDVVTIKTGLKKMGTKSAVFRQCVFNRTTNTLCADADITFVIAGIDGKAMKLEGELKELLEKIPQADTIQWGMDN